jgi:hypothetical protein
MLICMPTVSTAQVGCSINFDPATLKGPGIFESVLLVVRSFNPKGEAQRLSDLRQVVFQLQQKKSDLADTLHTVSQQNSVPAWLQAKTQQSPGVDEQIVSLLGKMRSEAKKGGLFAGDQSFADLSVVTDQKIKQLRELCILTDAQLPLNYETKLRLDEIVSVLRAEVSVLTEVDKELQMLIQKANEEARSQKKTG